MLSPVITELVDSAHLGSGVLGTSRGGSPSLPQSKFFSMARVGTPNKPLEWTGRRRVCIDSDSFLPATQRQRWAHNAVPSIVIHTRG